MKLYKVGYYGWEEHDYAVLAHESELTDRKLEKLVFSVVPDAIRNLKAREYCFLHGFESELWREVVRLLCERHGFQNVEFAGEWYGCSNHSIFDLERGRGVSAEHKRLIKAVQAAGFTRRDDDFLREMDAIGAES
jgi:hypothetical protein